MMRVVAFLVLVMVSSNQGYVIRCSYCRAASPFGVRSAAGTVPATSPTSTTVSSTTTPAVTTSTTTTTPASTTTTTTATTTTAAPTTTTKTAVSVSTATTHAATANSSKTTTTARPVAKPGRGQIDYGVVGLATTLRSHLPSNESVVLSPLSIASVLAALQMGAHGTTAQQIATVLGQGAASDWDYWNQLGDVLHAINKSTAVTASLANAVFIDKGLCLSHVYERYVKSVLSSEALTADFAGHPSEATDSINQWVSDKTHGKIPKVLEEPVDSDTVLAVASALYFNGKWVEQFQLNATKRAPFIVSETEVIEVDMMQHSTSVLFAWDEASGCQVLGLPYKDEDFAMFLVLPGEHGVAGLKKLETEMSSTVVQLMDSADWAELPYYVPRMRLEASFHLNHALAAAGVTDMFNVRKADLTGILHRNTSAHLFVGDVVHSVVVDVTETGTEAAAATVATTSRAGTTMVFRLNRPFLFVLQHRPTGVPLFWGSVVRPTPHYPTTQQ